MLIAMSAGIEPADRGKHAVPADSTPANHGKSRHAG
jgi:hypothetical protein